MSRANKNVCPIIGTRHFDFHGPTKINYYAANELLLNHDSL